jgi:hypothetical protein
MSERENILENIDYHSHEIRLLEDRLKWHKERLSHWQAEMRSKSKKLNVRIPVVNNISLSLDAWEELEDGSLNYKIMTDDPFSLTQGVAKPGEWHYK